MILSLLAGYLETHPGVDRCLSRVDAALGRPVAHALQAYARRVNLRLQIRCCGGKAPWCEGEAALSARLERLARTGRT